MKLLLALAFCAIASAGWFSQKERTTSDLPPGYSIVVTSNSYFFVNKETSDVLVVLPRASVAIIKRGGEYMFLLPDGTTIAHDDMAFHQRACTLAFEKDCKDDGYALPEWYTKKGGAQAKGEL